MRLAAISAVLAAGCSTPVPSKPAYEPDIAPILEANCVRCHTAATAVSLGSCVELDRWDDGTDPTGVCPTVQGVHSSTVDMAAPQLALVAVVESGAMPKDGPALTDRQKQIFRDWMAAGFPERADNQPPTIQFITPPASGATINTGGATTYDIQYDVEDPDGDAVTWSLAWKGSNGKQGTFATGLAGGMGTVHADTSSLGPGSYQLIASLDDGSGMPVTATAPGQLTVPSSYNAAPTVGMLTPAGGEYFDTTQTITVSWLGNDDGPSVTCDVVAISGSTTLPIASNVTEASGQMASVTWNLASVTPATNWQIEVTVHETDGSQTASAMSGAFVISGPPQNVSFSGQILPLFESSSDGCVRNGCHGNTNPQQGLNLTSSAAYQSIVNVMSSECGSEKLIDPGSPNTSYLIAKLVGSGTCFTGSMMPKGEPAFTPTQIQLIRDWTTNGAPNN